MVRRASPLPSWESARVRGNAAAKGRGPPTTNTPITATPSYNNNPLSQGGAGGVASPLPSWERARVRGNGAAKGRGPPTTDTPIIRILVHTFNKNPEFLSPILLTTNTSVLF